MKKAIIAAALAACVAASSAYAGSRTHGVISGNAVSNFAGPCDVGYSQFCPSGNCQCQEFTGTIKGNLIGTGSTTIFVTIDYGAGTGPTVAPSCYPFFASLAIDTSKDSEIVNATGTSCLPAYGGTATLTGSFGIDSSNIAGLSGWGTLKGSLNTSTGAIVIRFSGTVF